MSKIALTPNASGSGTFTIASPNSDTDRTLTLPDEAGTVLTNSGYITADGTNLILKADGTNEDARIDSSGNLLVGATSSRGQFTLGDYADFEATNKNLRAMCESGGAIQFSTKGTATTNLAFIQFGRSASSPGSYTSEGNIQTDGSGNLAFVNASDARLKTNIRDLDNGLSIAMLLKPRIFDWLDEEKPKNVKGFIAQELEEILPRTVSESEDGVKQVGITNELLPILVKSIQELKTELDTVKAELETLKGASA